MHLLIKGRVKQRELRTQWSWPIWFPNLSFFCYSDILGFHESNFSNFIFKHPRFSSLHMESFPCADSRWKRNQKLQKSAVQRQKVRGGRKWAAGAGERKRFFFFSFRASKWEKGFTCETTLLHTQTDLRSTCTAMSRLKADMQKKKNPAWYGTPILSCQVTSDAYCYFWIDISGRTQRTGSTALSLTY